MSTTEAQQKTEQPATEEPAKKRPRTRKSSGEKTVLCMNVDHLLCKEWQDKSFHELLSAPIHALHGVAAWSDDVADKLKIHSIKDLAHWRFFLRARAMVRLAEEEIEGHRSVSSKLNANKALDKKYEGKSLHEIMDLPPSALQGLAKHADDELRAFHVENIRDLGNWKIATIAHAIAVMAKCETDD